MSDADAFKNFDTVVKNRAPSRALPWTPIFIALCAAFMAWLAASEPSGPDRARDADIFITPPDQDQGAFVRMTVSRALIGGKVRTPTWGELGSTYGLRDSELQAVMAEFNRQRSGGPPPEKSTPIPDGTEVVLTVQ